LPNLESSKVEIWHLITTLGELEEEKEFGSSGENPVAKPFQTS
jgi:hypothetical protein